MRELKEFKSKDVDRYYKSLSFTIYSPEVILVRDEFDPDVDQSMSLHR